MKKYEITLYNKAVREAVADGKSHRQYDDGWADQRFIQIEAHDSREARNIIHRRHPAHKGFVVIDVTRIPDFE